jgi:DNA-directed RNA polymerase subunit RPC12/RpoP
MRKAKCPACKKVVQLMEDIKVQDLILCPYCNVLLEVVSQFPPTLDWIEKPEECSSHRIIKRTY